MTTRVAQGGVVFAVTPSAPVRMAQGGVIFAVTEGTPDVDIGLGSEEFRQRASKFVIDGHTFYAIRLGKQGTWLYDMSTDQWCQWKTLGDGLWDSEYNHDWFRYPIGGDREFPVIRSITPNNGNDEDFLPIQRELTGIVPWRSRDRISVSAVRFTVSAGAPFVDGADFQLRWSDDAGNTFSNYLTIDVATSDFDQDISFRSLGTIQKPGRVFEQRDMGGTVRIDGADIEHDGET